MTESKEEESREEDRLPRFVLNTSDYESTVSVWCELSRRSVKSVSDGDRRHLEKSEEGVCCITRHRGVLEVAYR